jgi:hypothetical protein
MSVARTERELFLRLGVGATTKDYAGHGEVDIPATIKFWLSNLKGCIINLNFLPKRFAMSIQPLDEVLRLHYEVFVE